MEEPDDWNRLVEHLDAWTSASVLTAGRIEVEVPQKAGSRQVVVVMTADEWDDMAGVMWGSFDDALREVKETLLQLKPDETFAVYSLYQLCPSTEATLPESLPPMPGPGEWVAYDRDGLVESRLADWSDPGERH